MDLFLNDGLCVGTGGETSSGHKLATLSRKLTQTEDPGQRAHHRKAMEVENMKQD